MYIDVGLNPQSRGKPRYLALNALKDDTILWQNPIMLSLDTLAKRVFRD